MSKNMYYFLKCLILYLFNLQAHLIEQCYALLVLQEYNKYYILNVPFILLKAVK